MKLYFSCSKLKSLTKMACSTSMHYHSISRRIHALNLPNLNNKNLVYFPSFKSICSPCVNVLSHSYSYKRRHSTKLFYNTTRNFNISNALSNITHETEERNVKNTEVDKSNAIEGENSMDDEPGNESKTNVKKRVVSGVQPTGSIHLGNYLGAIKNWINLQDDYDTLFFVVDLHAITLPHDPKELSESTKKSAAIYLACGIDPKKSSIFVQSHVQAHSELCWLLTCTTPISWLNKMIQFKEKSKKAGEDVGSGLLTYPLLMASDILLYQCDTVPVGEDQKQHLELTRDVAMRINHLYGGKKWKKRGGKGGRIFKVPEAMIPPAGARVMSLTDGMSKMSKSAPSDQSRINLLDSPDEIANKIKRCKTDSFVGMEFDNQDRPECNNLLSIYQLVSGKSKDDIALEVQDLNWGQFKPLLTDALIQHLKPIQNRYEEIMREPDYLDSVLRDGAFKANKIANVTLSNVYDAMGFYGRK